MARVRVHHETLGYGVIPHSRETSQDRNESVRWNLKAGAVVVASQGLAAVAMATADDIAMDELTAAADVSYILLCSTIVFVLPVGFAALSVGRSRAENSAASILVNVVDIFVGLFVFYFVGHTIAYGVEANAGYNNTIIGRMHVSIRDMDGRQLAEMVFQMSFASISVLIVSSTLLERVRLKSFVVLTAFLNVFLHSMIAHWVWSPTGWLSASNANPSFGRPLIDFAGGGVIHLVGGIAGGILTYLIGPREGLFNSRGDVKSMPGFSMQLSGLGLLMIWFGLFGINCGWTLGISRDRYKLAAQIAINTVMAGSSAGVASVVGGGYDGALNFEDLLNSTLTGLVAVTSSCAGIGAGQACFIGVIASIFYYNFKSLSQYLAIDDPLRSFCVHGGGGLWALINAGIFVNSSASVSGPPLKGALYGDFHQLGVQLAGTSILLLWVCFWTPVLFFIVDKVISLRDIIPDERAGADGTFGLSRNMQLAEARMKLLQATGLDMILKSPHDPNFQKFLVYTSKVGRRDALDFVLDVDKYIVHQRTRISGRSSIGGTAFSTTGITLANTTSVPRLSTFIGGSNATFQPSNDPGHRIVESYFIHRSGVRINPALAENCLSAMRSGEDEKLFDALNRARNSVVDELKRKVWPGFIKEVTSS